MLIIGAGRIVAKTAGRALALSTVAETHTLCDSALRDLTRDLLYRNIIIHNPTDWSGLPGDPSHNKPPN